MHFAFTARTLVLLVALTYAASPILAETTTGYENPYENSYESNTQVAKPKSHSMRSKLGSLAAGGIAGLFKEL
ncbi:hypothetical protein SYNPS1DRAFT_24683 [Syncephalis pseudoplumigaleata]|uniref:Uncharacterized protein n=1 Tax=Syncephalis pseudoplumigaleata TaxID=1712513 RepID=A0A4P9YWH6_9FUNG|nr:hypothetical protein SYNPS1DRAFT_24683 [Syncephalis pseudoplumigaleata]|eukprot:RKP23290.1 hypothetical protein SYNPS1DRAFT_24683 [Syncephalis pseudoplumigaleata]